MHPNPAYRFKSADENLDFARERGFGVLALAGPEGPLASHVPFVMDQTGSAFDAHVVRSNPIRLALADAAEDGLPALMVVSGPDAYISPDWYGIEDQVPTWNYVAVHLFGRLRLLPEGDLRGHLEALSDCFESRLAPKPEWRLDKVSSDTFDRLARMICPVRFEIERVEGTWKFSQNKADSARLAAASEVSRSAVGMEPPWLARLMAD